MAACAADAGICSRSISARATPRRTICGRCGTRARRATRRGRVAALRDALPRVYEALDRALGRLLAAAGGDAVEVTLASDHGSGGSSAKVLYLNRVLEQAGLLRMRGDAAARGALAAALKQAALRRLPPRLRERAFRAGVERAAELARVARALRRDRHAAHDVVQRRAQLLSRAALQPARPRAERHARSARPRARAPRRRSRAVRAARSAHRRTHGARAARTRGAVRRPVRGTRARSADRARTRRRLQLQPDAVGRRAHRRVVPRARAREYLGRKGRSLPGSHRPFGLYVAAGPHVRACGRIDAAIADASATLLARMDVAGPERGSGRVLADPREQCGPQRRARVAGGARCTARAASSDDARVAARLRNLGYIE